jgi:hypothetical protein
MFKCYAPTIAQLVERRTVESHSYPSVAGSIPACRRFFFFSNCTELIIYDEYYCELML